MSTRTILVTGATGNQGRAVADALIPMGHRVRAMVRNPGDPKAAELKAMGIELVPGSFDDPQSLQRAAEGVDAVFAVTTPAAGVDLEVRQGKALADAAQAAGVGHLVFSSVANGDRGTGIPHFDSKYEIETYLRTLDIPWTITGPAFFFNNVLFPWNVDDLKRGLIRQALAPDVKLQQIAAEDIGRFNAHVLDVRDPFIGRRIDIAGDALSGSELAAALSEATGRSIAYGEQTLDEVREQFEDMATMYEWLAGTGFSVDIEALRRDYPEVGWTTFAQWAGAQDWNAILKAAGQG
ncbi:MAG: NmrA/HSCARG family protein [SAR324 cluster bacterium]|nr:NmrA/HSCARG family protein [SAR324 cluster bacterium]